MVGNDHTIFILDEGKVTTQHKFDRIQPHNHDKHGCGEFPNTRIISTIITERKWLNESRHALREVQRKDDAQGYS